MIAGPLWSHQNKNYNNKFNNLKFLTDKKNN